MLGLLWLLRVLLMLLVLYAGIQALIVRRLTRPLRTQSGRTMIAGRLEFRSDFPCVESGYWRRLADRGVRVVVFDFDRFLGYPGTSTLYEGVDQALDELRKLGVAVYVMTNSRSPLVQQAFESVRRHNWCVRVIRVPEPSQWWQRMWLVSAIWRYLHKKPWRGYLTPAIDQIRRETGCSASQIWVGDDKLENLLGALPYGVRALWTLPMPGRDYAGDKFWALRWRERLMFRILGIDVLLRPVPPQTYAA